jgi:2-polyprenyl-3-methyl-5-hydroxy-6-metoxy-1,4-benzoquinol methylase
MMNNLNKLKMELEFVESCPLCKGVELVLSHQSTDNLVSGDLFSVYKCTSCDFRVTSPRPTSGDAGSYYNSASYVSHNDVARGWMPKIYRVVRDIMIQHKLRIVERYKEKNPGRKNMLDIGCGTGEFLLKAKKMGYNTTGFEPDKNASETAINKGLNIITGDDRLKELSPKYFDVVTLWHVLEHMYHPKDRIEILENTLRDHGIMIVAIPEYESFDGKYYMQNWAGWDLPRHVYHYNESTLTRVMDELNFKLIGKHALIFDSFYISLLSEKNLNSRLGLFRAIIIGFLSNLMAIFSTYPFSSQIYVFKKAQTDND